MFGMEQGENKWRGPEGDVKIKKFKENIHCDNKFPIG